MPSWKILKELLETYHSESDSQAAWISAFTPSEILTSMGLRCFYPESLAAALSSSNKNKEFIDFSRSQGYSENICSYALLFAGRGGQRSKFRRFPDPDLLVSTNNQCGTILYWWQILQKDYGLPLHFIDYPKFERQFLPAEKEYIGTQYQSLIDSLEALTGRKMDYEKLWATIENSIRTNELWREIQELRKEHYIAPRLFADSLQPMVVMKGHAKTVEFYEELLKEIKTEFVGKTVKKRLLWLGYPFWFLRDKYPHFGEDAGIVMDMYTSWWLLDYAGVSWSEKLANAYGKTFLNMPLSWKIRRVEELISEYRIDGVVTHLNKSCKRDGIGLVLINEHIKNTLDIPSLVLESDMANPDWYNSESIELNIEAFLEML